MPMKRALIFVLALAGCAPQVGLAPTEVTGGPVVRYDIDAEPLPEIPLPNDTATRLDPTSATGRRLNFSVVAGRTEHERETRAKFDRLDGFGAYAPIFVSFDAPLDVRDLNTRHEADDDFRNDAVYLLNVDRDCDRYGEEIALDMGGGHFPTAMWKKSELTPNAASPGGFELDEGGNRLFPYDIHGTYTNTLFEERNEAEDLDADGVLDVANLYEPAACDGLEPGVARDQCVQDNLLTFYERQTNTLILRMLWPMEQQCTHAVVLTKRLVGEDGAPVQSPFPAVHHRDQQGDLAPLAELLPRYDLGLHDVAFAWTFTVGSMTKDLEALRAGLYSHGPFARLGTEFPVSSFSPWTRADLAAMRFEEPTEGLGDQRLLPGACVGDALSWLWGPALNEWEPNLCAIEADLSSIGGLFGGTFSAPNLLVDTDGIATPRYPADNDEVWDLDHQTGEATYGSTDVTFWCALPREAAECPAGNPEGTPFCKPYPVIFYAHGYGGSRAEITLHMGRHTAMGYAMCGVDSYGHGLSRWFQAPDETQAFDLALGRFTQLGVRELGAMMIAGRDRDLNNDGKADSGMDMWTSDVFHTRDMVRQSVLEEMQFVRILRAMDGIQRDDSGALLGDIDGDGVIDLGGPRNTVGMWGISLGGILSGVAAGAEPGLDAVSPNAGGAGLTNISTRSSQAGVPEAVVMPMLGQLVAGCLPVDGDQQPLITGEGKCPDGGETLPAGRLQLQFFNQDQASFRERIVGFVDGVQPGDRVELENLVNGEIGRAVVSDRGWFRTSVATDALGPIERRPLLGLADNQRGPVVAADNLLLADALEVRIYVGDSDELRGAVSTFQEEVEFQGTVYSAGSPLVALQEGFGYQRNHPDFRRFVGFAQHAISSADPAIWGAHSLLDPIDVSAYDPNRAGGETHTLMMPTTGDANVPVDTGIAMGRVSGLLGSWERDPERFGPEVGWRELFAPDERYGVSIDQWLIDVWAVEGVPRLQRWAGHDPINPNVLYDVDDVSDGTATFTCGPSDWSALIGENGCPDEVDGQEVFFDVPNPEPGKALRANWQRADGSWDAFRLPMLRPAGQHGIYNSQSFRTFDADAYMVNFTVRFLGTRGGTVEHVSGCDCSCSALPNFVAGGEPDDPALGRACTGADVNVCRRACAEAWGIRTPEAAVCE